MLAAALVLTGCGLRIPTDPDGTLDRARGDELRVGASPADGLVRIDGAAVTGPLAEVIEEFAASIDARVTWSVGSEEDLVDDLSSARLDLAIGGMTEQTPWATEVSVTRGYPGIPGAKGAPVVVLLPMGENALQAELESFLDEEYGR
ncbi:transporter substrate-binding domain-containing protein [Microbacterium aureliae]